MKNKISFFACLVIGLVLISYRMAYPGFQNKEPLKLTTWDAYGYYLYLPSTFIYKDLKELKFQDSIEHQYQLSGGNFYQANKHEETGNYVFKYLGGIAIMHLPFFATAHLYALNSDYPADGFSPPYQNAIGFGVVLYSILALFILRKVLLKFYSDQVTSLTLILLVLASNAIQYISIDSAQSHAPIFLLYSLILYLTIRWHEKPSILTAFLAGIIIGLATICRPTEAIMVLIPILWNTHNKESATAKWALVKANMNMVYLAALGGLIGILPQLIYWKYVSGHWIYDVGSAWRFLSPFFRVLFGFEKGWFIYTPVTIFFVLGLLCVKNYPYRKSILWFCLLNIWIIISWSDWKYGGSYSTRALMQSYPVFALPFAAFLTRFWVGSNRIIIGFLGVLLIVINLFQVKQYNQTILHYYDMNRAYYARIFLNPNPTPLDKSLLDNSDWLSNENDYRECIIVDSSYASLQQLHWGQNHVLYHKNPILQKIDYLRIDATLQTPKGGGYLISELIAGDSIKLNKVRLNYPGARDNQITPYSFYVEVPEAFKNASLRLSLLSNADTLCSVQQLKITGLSQ